MNVEIGAEAALFLEKEYINGIAVAVWWILQQKGQQSRLQLGQLIGLQLQPFFQLDVDTAASGVSWYGSPGSCGWRIYELQLGALLTAAW